MGLDPDVLTWAGLLAQWTDFAKAALALPADAEGERWRAAVPDVITVQAVTLALGELDRLEPRDRPFARDRAGVLVRECSGRLERGWAGTVMPDEIVDLMVDARAALAAAVYVGATELVWPGPGAFVVPAVPVGGTDGTLAVMQPGTLAMPGEPVAWWVERDGTALAAALPGLERRATDAPRQVYRQLDDAGRITGDVLRPITADPVAGLPLLVPLCCEGRAIGRFTVAADDWERTQRAAMDTDEIPVTTTD